MDSSQSTDDSSGTDASASPRSRRIPPGGRVGRGRRAAHVTRSTSSAMAHRRVPRQTSSPNRPSASLVNALSPPTSHARASARRRRRRDLSTQPVGSDGVYLESAETPSDHAERRSTSPSKTPEDESPSSSELSDDPSEEWEDLAGTDNERAVSVTRIHHNVY